MNRFDAGIGGVSIAVVVALCVAYGTSRSLAFSTHDRWRIRKDTAKTQLNDLTVQLMLKLQAELNGAISNMPAGPAPMFALDPIQFRGRTLDAARCFDMARAVDVRFEKATRYARFVPRALEFAIAASLWITVRFSWKRDWWSWTAPTAIIAAGVAAIALVLIYLAYLFQIGRLEKIVIHAQQSPP